MNDETTQFNSELIEVYSCIQGEGSMVGVRQILVRYGKCDIACRYCDTPLCHSVNTTWRVENRAGSREFTTIPNPASPAAILDVIGDLNAEFAHHSVALTGGEPLLHTGSIKAIAPAIREMGLGVYLETNGHLVAPLREVLGLVDTVAMDVKIRSTTGFPARLPDNKLFLEAVKEAGCPVFAKIVVGAGTTSEEIKDAVCVLVDVDSTIEIILQPVSPCGGSVETPSPSHLLELQEAGLSLSPRIKVIPQTHKMLDQL